MKALDAKAPVSAWPAFDKKLIAVGSNEQSGLEIDKQGGRVLTGIWQAGERFGCVHSFINKQNKLFKRG
jgi:hypothetical protein